MEIECLEVVFFFFFFFFFYSHYVLVTIGIMFVIVQLSQCYQVPNMLTL